jgi:hypothetical protein
LINESLMLLLLMMISLVLLLILLLLLLILPRHSGPSLQYLIVVQSRPHSTHHLLDLMTR